MRLAHPVFRAALLGAVAACQGPAAAAAQIETSHVPCADCHLPGVGQEPVGDVSAPESPPGALLGAESVVCLVCHPADGGGGTGAGMPGWTGLADHHPVGSYDPLPTSGLRATVGGSVPAGGSLLPLYAGRVECTTCHDPHGVDPGTLRVPNQGSALCLACHRA